MLGWILEEAFVLSNACRARCFLVDFPCNLFDVCRLEFLFVVQIARQQQAIADRVDSPWYATAGLEDRLE